jgi:HlyD family secretion protein
MSMLKGRVVLAWVAVAAVAAAALAVAFLPAKVEVDVAAVARGAFERTIDEDGKTRVRERYVVSAPLAGRVLRSKLKAGDAVRAGDVVATLIPSAPALIDERTERELRERLGAAEAAHARANAEVERARVALEQARGDLTRAAQLAEKGFTSAQALERNQRDVELKVKEQKSAEFDREAARHEVGVARAALARSQIAWTRQSDRQWTLTAPVAGRVLRVAQESEAAVGVGAPLVEIGNPGDLEVVVDVLTTDTPAIRRGQPVRLDVGTAAAALSGRVRLIEPAAFTKVSALGVEEQRVNVVIDFDAPREAWQALGDAYRVDARIVVESRADAIVVPVSALFRQGERWHAFVVDGGRARRVEVVPGPRNATQAVIERGLEPGAEVIVFPGDRVADGVRIRVRR